MCQSCNDSVRTASSSCQETDNQRSGGNRNPLGSDAPSGNRAAARLGRRCPTDLKGPGVRSTKQRSVAQTDPLSRRINRNRSSSPLAIGARSGCLRNEVPDRRSGSNKRHSLGRQSKRLSRCTGRAKALRQLTFRRSCELHKPSSIGGSHPSRRFTRTRPFVTSTSRRYTGMTAMGARAPTSGGVLFS